LLAASSSWFVFPFAHEYSFLIKYLLMTMLFFSFLKMDVKIEHFTKSHIYIFLINVFVPLVAYFLIKPFNIELSQVAFITAIAPTAIASPVIINLLKGKSEFTVISILITNFGVALILPFLLPALLNNSNAISTIDVLIPVANVFLLPYFLALFLKKLTPKITPRLAELNKFMFYVLIININLGTSKASNYIQQEMSFSDPVIYTIAIVSLLFCVLYFNLGRISSPKEYEIEGGQSLGQKNNGFTIWIALTFISPLAVLGPVFYILFQNIYISWQLHNQARKSSGFTG